MLKYIKYLVLAWKLRDKIKAVVIEIKEDADIIRKSLQDGKLTQDEGLAIINEIREDTVVLKDLIESL